MGPGVGGTVSCRVGSVLGLRLGAVDGERDGVDDVDLLVAGAAVGTGVQTKHATGQAARMAASWASL